MFCEVSRAGVLVSTTSQYYWHSASTFLNSTFTAPYITLFALWLGISVSTTEGLSGITRAQLAHTPTSSLVGPALYLASILEEGRGPVGPQPKTTAFVSAEPEP